MKEESLQTVHQMNITKAICKSMKKEMLTYNLKNKLQLQVKIDKKLQRNKILSQGRVGGVSKIC